MGNQQNISQIKMRRQRKYFCMTNMSNKKFITIADCKFVFTLVVEFHREVVQFSSNMVGGFTVILYCLKYKT